MTRWASWAAGVALLVAAWLVALVTPPDDAAEQPFAVTAEVGEPAQGRNLAVTVTGVRAADEVSLGGWSAAGTWVVVDLDAAAVRSAQGTLLSYATLTIGDREYRASERPATASLTDAMFRTALIPGIPRSGSLAFELAPDARAGTAVLRLGIADDPRLDSLIELRIDLDEVPVEPAAELRETGWAS